MCIVAPCCGPGVPGNALKSGSPLSARLIFSDVPSQRKPRMAAMNSGSTAAVSISSRKVRLGSQQLATFFAEISSPDARATPVARPLAVRMRETGAVVRISAPEARAGGARLRVLQTEGAADSR